MIKLARGLDLPIDAVTQTFGIIARKGAGKTYAAMKMAEGMMEIGSQIVCLDPVGVWYGLRLGADGKSKGFPIPVLGGDQGDIPLEHTAGKLVADMIMDTGTSAVLDVSLFRKGQRKEFVAQFSEQLFHRAKRKRDPLHIFFEEAQIFAPQRPGPGEQRMLGSIEDIVRLGRNYGIGASLISQRPQSINKEVLNQVEALLVMQVNAAHERKAINEWIVHQDIDVGEMAKELPSLPIGVGYLWSPQWLGILQKVHIRKKKTFDSSSTPKVGQTRTKPKKLMKVDLGALEQAMSDTIEKTKANDPRELQKQLVISLRTITELEHELENQSPEIKEIKIPVMNKKEIESVSALGQKIKTIGQEIVDALTIPSDALNHLGAVAGALMIAAERINKGPDYGSLNLEPGVMTPGKKEEIIINSTPEGRSPAHGFLKKGERPKDPKAKMIGRLSMTEERPITKYQQALLDAIADYNSIGIDHPIRQIVAAHAGVSPKSSYFRNNLSKLCTSGYLGYPTKGTLTLTDLGIAASQACLTPITLDGLQDRWLGLVTKYQRDILVTLIDRYPQTLSRYELARLLAVSDASSYFRNNISLLSTLGVLTYPEKGHVAATDLLFPVGLT